MDGGQEADGKAQHFAQFTATVSKCLPIRHVANTGLPRGGISLRPPCLSTLGVRHMRTRSARNAVISGLAICGAMFWGALELFALQWTRVAERWYVAKMSRTP
jgi:hypothetical protein